MREIRRLFEMRFCKAEAACSSKILEQEFLWKIKILSAFFWQCKLQCILYIGLFQSSSVKTVYYLSCLATVRSKHWQPSQTFVAEIPMWLLVVILNIGINTSRIRSKTLAFIVMRYFPRRLSSCIQTSEFYFYISPLLVVILGLQADSVSHGNSKVLPLYK